MVTLVILDGFGERRQKHGNAIKQAGTPNLDKLKKIYPSCLIEASGEFVGLPKGQMGNSEVGHLNLGAGKVVYQDLPRINKAIGDKELDQNQNLLKAFKHTKTFNSSLHIMGLLSNGGVHSHNEHLYRLIELAEENGVERIYIHAFLDGRDTPPKSAVEFLSDLEKNKKSAVVSSIVGRYYAMDREQRYDRVNKAYDMLCFGRADNYYQDSISAINDLYESGLTDEFITPTIIGKPNKIEPNDSVIFFNFRTDRARELSYALTDKTFDKFETKRLDNLYFLSMTEYDKNLKNVKVIFEPEKIENNLSSIVSNAGLKQFHISETTKYAHVTFFFNGGIEKAYENEDRVLVESENVKNFAETPKMKAIEIAQKTCDAIAENKYDFVLVNFSNADMLGHTGDFEATKETIRVVDKCAYMVALATIMAGGDCIITADHGNAELMLDKNKNVITSHTTSKVPFILVSEKYKKSKLIKDGKLANVAPTILKMLHLDIPDFMEKTIFAKKQ